MVGNIDESNRMDSNRLVFRLVLETVELQCKTQSSRKDKEMVGNVYDSTRIVWLDDSSYIHLERIQQEGYFEGRKYRQIDWNRLV